MAAIEQRRELAEARAVRAAPPSLSSPPSRRRLRPCNPDFFVGRRTRAAPRAQAAEYVDPRRAREERLLAEKAGRAVGDKANPPAGLFAAIEKRREAVEAQMKAIEEGQIALYSPRAKREAEMAAASKRRFANRGKTKKAVQG